MALPKIDIPTFEATLPILGTTVKFRPFLVKEHKILMMLQGSDADGIAKICADLITTCTFGKVDGNKLSSLDLEYLFLQIRAKSVGETYDFIVTCGNCSEQYEADASIANIEVVRPEGHEYKILLTPKIGVEMQEPVFTYVLNVVAKQDQDAVMAMIKSSIKAIYTPETYIEIDDSNKEELDEFLEHLTKDQFDKIENFFTTQPRLFQTIDTVCKKCGANSHVEVTGLENFFV